MKKTIIATLLISVVSVPVQAAYNPNEAQAATAQINQGLQQSQAPDTGTQTAGKNNIIGGISRIEAMTGGKYDAAASASSNQPATSSPSADTAASAHPDYSGEAAKAYNAALTAAKYASANSAQPAADTSATAHPDYSGEAARAYNAALTAAKYAAANSAQPAANPSATAQPAANPSATAQPTANPSATAHPDYSVDASNAKFQALTAIKEQKIQAYQAAQVAQRYSAVNNVASGSINVAASSLHPDTPVSVSFNGVTQTTTAGELAAQNPTIQVAVPHVQAIINSPIVKGGQDRNGKHSGTVGHDGRGQDNAHSHAFGGHGYGADNSRSEGFGGHSHFH